MNMMSFSVKGTTYSFDRPIVMGIINATPDSFYAGSRKQDLPDIIEQAEKMVAEGATIIDIGGQSTRPGSERISVEEELARVIPAIEAVTHGFPEVLVSIDTYSSVVAEAAVQAGAHIVNDISAGEMDSQMIPTVALLNVPYIAMHMQGTPDTMQHEPHYEDVTRDVYSYFENKLEQIRTAGIKDVILDPGFGFGKTIDHNFYLLRNLSSFKTLGVPLLVGLSRKSTVYKTLDTTPEHALNGTTVLNTIALLNGADMLRVHDVKEAREAIQLIARYQEQIH